MELAEDEGVPVLIVVGESFGASPVPVVSLVEAFGRERAFADTLGCIREAVTAHLRALA